MNELYWNILIIVIFIAGLGILWYYGKKELVKKIILTLVIQAETRWGSGTGKIKFAEVLSSVYDRLPYIIKLVVTVPVLEKWIEDAVAYIKAELLKDNMTIEQYLASKSVI